MSDYGDRSQFASDKIHSYETIIMQTQAEARRRNRFQLG